MLYKYAVNISLLAVPKSVQQIQVFLVEDILEAYLNQGVKFLKNM